jgi:transketolase
LNVNPATSLNWPNRDRFILSAGHGSAMLYSLLHLAGYQVTIDDLKNFRQWESKTPGHPEYQHTDGVEATSGPLGQGISTSVGMAMAEAHLAATYNRDSFNVMDHYTYALCGDGDLMEGVSAEASSMAGHMKLGKLIVLYDSNDISLDGPTSKAFTENVGARYEAYGWQHILVKDGNDLEAISKAIDEAKAETEKPSLIEIKTVIGFGSPKEGTSAVHGAPIGQDGIDAAKTVYGWEYPDFTVPEEVAKRFKEEINDKGAKTEAKWDAMFANYEKAHPELAKQFKAAFAGELPENWEEALPVYEEGTAQASRVSSKDAIQAIAKAVPNVWGGSADLSGSNNTTIADEKEFQPGSYEGRNIWFGVREFAMASAMNGIHLHGGTRVYGGTFFVFTDYLRPAVRMSAIQNLPVIYVLTHDSVAVGEDGPTHEPIEQLASVRCMPNVQVIRPADGNETSAAWIQALETTNKPTILVLSRQNLPVLPNSKEMAKEGVSKGGYVISKAESDTPEGILIATGSEVNLAVQAQKELKAQGKDVSVVSLPSFDLFEAQDEAYKESVLPKAVTKRVAIEAASPFGWERYIGTEGKMIGIDHFGASAPGDFVLEQFGFTVDNVVNTFNEL